MQAHDDPPDNTHVHLAYDADAWSSLLSLPQDRSVFTSRAWVGAAWRHLPTLGSPAIIIARIGPMTWALPMAYDAATSTLRIAGAPLGDVHDLIGPRTPHLQVAAQAIIDTLRRETRETRTIELGAVTPDGALGSALVRDGRWRVEREPAPVIATSGHERRTARAANRWARLKRQGQARLLCHRDDTSVDPWRIRQFVLIRHRRWRERGRYDELPTAERCGSFPEFFADAVFNLVGRDLARLWELQLDGVPIAEDLHLGERSSPLLYMRTFDPQYSLFSPGQILLENTLPVLRAEDNASSLQTGRGDEPYKMALGGDDSGVLNAATDPIDGTDRR